MQGEGRRERDSILLLIQDPSFILPTSNTNKCSTQNNDYFISSQHELQKGIKISGIILRKQLGS